MSLKKRICSNCGQETTTEYSDEEWEARGEQCEDCEYYDEEAELLALDII